MAESKIAHCNLTFFFQFSGLIEVFCARVCQHPASIATRAYHIIVKHLDVAYNNLDVFGHCGDTRKAIFQLFMKLRANNKFHLGVEEERGAPVHFSPYLICRSPMKVTWFGDNLFYEGIFAIHIYYVQSRTEARILIRIEISNRKRNIRGLWVKIFDLATKETGL